MDILSIIIILLYFLPTLVASNKTHLNQVAILNVFLGWTFIVWVIALVWALGGQRK